MSTSLKEFCELLKKCAVTLEEEIKRSIEKCQSIISSERSNSKLALDKAKDYHNKEIITILSGIITYIKQIIYHEEKIRQLSNKEKLTDEELKKYSYVKRQVSAFSGGEKVVRREIRRAASENSVYCLDTWEQYLKEEESSKDVLYSYNSLPNITIVQKRDSPKNKRKQKKLTSSTFENILEDEEVLLRPMGSLSEEASGDLSGKQSYLSRSTSEIDCHTTAKTENIQVEKENLIEEINVQSTLKEKGDKEINQAENVSKSHQTNKNAIIENAILPDANLDTKPRIVGFMLKENLLHKPTQ